MPGVTCFFIDTTMNNREQVCRARWPSSLFIAERFPLAHCPLARERNSNEDALSISTQQTLARLQT